MYMLLVFIVMIYYAIYGFVFSNYDRSPYPEAFRELFWKYGQIALHYFLMATLEALLVLAMSVR